MNRTEAKDLYKQLSVSEEIINEIQASPIISIKTQSSGINLALSEEFKQILIDRLRVSQSQLEEDLLNILNQKENTTTEDSDELKICSECGVQAKRKDAKFCFHCGEKLQNNTEHRYSNVFE